MRKGNGDLMSHGATLILVGALVIAPGCRHDDKLTISVAASLRQAAACVDAAPGDAPPFRLNVGGSVLLAQQILQGAPIDLFLSASLEELTTLHNAGRLQGAPVPIAVNRLVIAVPRGQTLPATWNELAESRFHRIGIADPALAPAGRYAVSTLRAEGLYETLKSRLYPAADVIHARTLLRMGEVDAALVYATDVPSDDPQLIVAHLPTNEVPPIVYGVGVLRGDNIEAARLWLDRLLSPEGRNCLGKLGFVGSTP